MERSFWNLLSKAFMRVALPVSGAAGLVATLIQFAAPPPTLELPFFWMAFGSVLLTLVVTTIAAAAYSAHQMARHALPRVLLAQRESSHTPPYVLCLLESSPLFGVGMAVSFYVIQNQFEVQVGLGEVMTVREDGTIQVALRWRVRGYAEEVARLANNDKSMLEALRVKPFVPATQVGYPGGIMELFQ
jgi:hypothetical protein